MIEELTPQLLAAGLLLVIGLSSLLTLLASSLVLWRYRRRILRAMESSAGAPPVMVGEDLETPAVPAGTPPDLSVEACRSCLERRPWRAEWRHALAGLAYVLVMSAAVGLAFPELASPTRIGLFGWGYAWPLVLALALSGPAGGRGASIAVALYFAPLALFTLGDLAFGGSAPATAFDLARVRAAVTPFDVARGWVLANAAPTLLLMAFLNRRVRAAGPLLLALIGTATAGVVVVWLALFSPRGSELVVALAVASGISQLMLLLAVAVLVLALFAALGWILLRRVRRAYLDKEANDRSLARDALWLYFAGVHAMFYAPAGLAWSLAPLLAFAAYKLAGRALRGASPAGAGGLTYLRVFSLGRRSDRLFEALARHWRHVGSLQVISGPDLAYSTIQPHQFLDFLAGRLASHFVSDAGSLARRIGECDRLPDRDGVYRVNTFICHADTWQAVLAELVRRGDRVLMDLRSFAAANAGCVHELTHLVLHVPLRRCVLLVDPTTDIALVRQTLRRAARRSGPDSPNRGCDPEAIPVFDFGGGRRDLKALLRRLCAAG